MRVLSLFVILMLSACTIGTGTDISRNGCGTELATCCDGTACNAGLVCVTGICQALCGAIDQSCCGGTACNATLLCQQAKCEPPGWDGGPSGTDGGHSNVDDGGTSETDGGHSNVDDGGTSETDGGHSNVDDGGTSETDGGHSNVDGGTPDGGSMMSCQSDIDCPGAQICADSACVDGCTADSDCDVTEYCKHETRRCTPGCSGDNRCSGLSCCDHVCTDTLTNPAANCGACGAPACASGNLCCDGACIDTQTDSMNCGSCGNDCAGVPCVGGTCQTGSGIVGLMDLTGKVSGSATTQEILKPLLYLRAGTLDYQSLINRPCFASHWDATHPPADNLNGGNVLISGYAGGHFVAGPQAPTQIGCHFSNGAYACGYGAVANSLVGAAPGESPFAAGTLPLGTGSISISAPGDTTFGSFDVSATPGTGFGVIEDLSTLTYSASADTVINIACPSGGCGLGGFIVLVQASSNDVAHFDEPSTAGGSLFCMGGFGGFGSFSLGEPVVTLAAADIGTMLGGDSSIRTFLTTVVSLSSTDLQNIGGARQMDSQGHQISALARTGSFGVSHQ